jgi:hypothetical protein
METKHWNSVGTTSSAFVNFVFAFAYEGHFFYPLPSAGEGQFFKTTPSPLPTKVTFLKRCLRRRLTKGIVNLRLASPRCPLPTEFQCLMETIWKCRKKFSYNINAIN